jgi:hypothetical protein
MESTITSRNQEMVFGSKIRSLQALAFALGTIGAIATHSPGHAQHFIASPNMTGTSGPWGGAAGFYADQDNKMVCGAPSASTSPGIGYAFNRYQLGSSDTLVAMHYQVSGTGVVSSNPGKVLNRPTVNFTAVGADPYPGTDPSVKNNVYIFGGGRGGIAFTNEFFQYNASGFINHDNTSISPTPTPANSPYRMGNGAISGRAAMGGVPVGGNKIFLFGGHDGASVRTEAYLFDRVSKNWAALASMPLGLQNARTLAAGGATGVSWVYAVGGAGIIGADSLNRKIFRYDLNVDKWIVLQDVNGNDISIPGTDALEIASVQGAMLILTHGNGGADPAMNVYRFTHPSTVTYGATGVLGTGKGATLTVTTFNVSARARSGFALLRCSPDTWVIGGSFGHGSSFSNRGAFVEKLTRY